MIEEGDLIQIKAKSDYLGVDCLNIWYYRVETLGTTPETAYEDLAEYFRDFVLPTLTAWQNSFYFWRGVELANLSNGVDIFNLAFTLQGTQTTVLQNCAPSFVTVGWKLIRGSRTTRNGYKRFSGLLDNQMSGNNAGLTQAQIDDVSDFIRASFSSDAGDFEDVIVKRPLPEPGDTYEFSYTIGAEFRGLGTQNSRKQ